MTHENNNTKLHNIVTSDIFIKPILDSECPVISSPIQINGNDNIHNHIDIKNECGDNIDKTIPTNVNEINKLTASPSDVLQDKNN